MTLPALPPTADPRTISERVNVIVRDYNREDTRVPIYALDTGSATAYVIAPIPGIEMYVVGQIFAFKAANANTGTAPTLAVNGLTAGTISFNGTALVAGDIAANGMTMVQVASTTPTFHLVNPLLSSAVSNTGATTFLAADVAFGIATTFQNGPNTGSIGANGQVWLITCVAQFANTSGGSSQMEAAIHDGTNYIANISHILFNNEGKVAPVSVVVTLSAATTFTLRARNNAGVAGTSLQTTGAATGVANKATSITAVRLA